MHPPLLRSRCLITGLRELFITGLSEAVRIPLLLGGPSLDPTYTDIQGSNGAKQLGRTAEQEQQNFRPTGTSGQGEGGPEGSGPMPRERNEMTSNNVTHLTRVCLAQTASCYSAFSAPNHGNTPPLAM